MDFHISHGVVLVASGGVVVAKVLEAVVSGSGVGVTGACMMTVRVLVEVLPDESVTT